LENEIIQIDAAAEQDDGFEEEDEVVDLVTASMIKTFSQI
jgi:hypothetical protein